MEKNTFNHNQKIEELSLEELDQLCRKCNHLHDEEVLRILSRFLSRLAHFFDSDQQQPCHSSAH